MSPNCSTTFSSPIAPRPSVSGHCENGPASIAAPGFSLKEWRGSVESVTGMPRRVPAASSCRRLCHSAIRVALEAAPKTLKWVMSQPSTMSLVGAIPERGVTVGQRAVFSDGDHRLEEQAGLLFERHLAEEILDTLLDGQRGVAEGGVDACAGVGGRDRA